jgi:hypothetical protein
MCQATFRLEELRKIAKPSPGEIRTKNLLNAKQKYHYYTETFRRKE